MELTELHKANFIATAKALKGSDRRVFMARTVKALGVGGQRLAEREFGWSRHTIRKGPHELDRGIRCLDAYAARGRKRAEVHWPHLLQDIRAIADSQSQTDPSFKTTRLYTRLTAAEVRRHLIAQKGDPETELPKAETINAKLNQLGYTVKKVAQSKPQKKIPETDALFAQLGQVNAAADAAEDPLRVSLDAKTAVRVGPFSRGGQSRVWVQAVDHDFQPATTLVPVGIFLPRYEELFLYFTASKLTSDCLVDTLEEWWQMVQGRFPQVQTLLLNQDNGPENHSRRTQFIKRMVAFAGTYHRQVKLAYYPPYHSKYKPVERCFGALENHWNGDLLDEVQTVLRCAASMTWQGKHPFVKLRTQTYETGVRLTAGEMKQLERQLQRLPTLKKWFVDIS